MKFLIHDRGTKQCSSGSSWVGSVEGVLDVKEIFADGTIVISPYQTDLHVTQTTVRTPGGVISLKRSGHKVEIGVARTSMVHLPKPPGFAVQAKKRKKQGDLPSSSTVASSCELSNVLSRLAEDVELYFSTF